VYAANNGSGTGGFSDSISAYTVNAATGSLTLIPGSPFAAVLGTGYSNVTVDPTGKFIYWTVQGNPNSTAFTGISAFATNSATGALTAVAGSPYVSPSVLPWHLVVDPSGTFAYALCNILGGPGQTLQGPIIGFAVNSATGALTPLSIGTSVPHTNLLNFLTITALP
jgi:hypothetical protein